MTLNNSQLNKEILWKRTRNVQIPLKKKKKVFGSESVPEDLIEFKENAIQYSIIEIFTQDTLIYRSNDVLRLNASKFLPLKYFGTRADELVIPKSAICDLELDANDPRTISITFRFKIEETQSSAMWEVTLWDLNQEDYESFKRFFPSWATSLPGIDLELEERLAVKRVRGLFAFSLIGTILGYILILIYPSLVELTTRSHPMLLRAWILILAGVAMIFWTMWEVKVVLRSSWMFDPHITNKSFMTRLNLLFFLGAGWIFYVLFHLLGILTL